MSEEGVLVASKKSIDLGGRKVTNSTSKAIFVRNGKDGAIEVAGCCIPAEGE